MAVLNLVYYPDERLRKKAKKIKTVDTQVVRLLREMAETMYANKGIGLAAPQVGVNRRVIVVHAYQDEDEEEGKGRLLSVVNPEIVQKNEAQEVAEEGCLSIPAVRGDVVRPIDVVVEGLDEEGHPVRLEVNGLEARVFQHEIDHLNGVLFIDYMDSLTREAVLKEYMAKRESVGP